MLADISLEQLEKDWREKDEKAGNLHVRASIAREKSDEAWETLEKARKRCRKACPRCHGKGYLYKQEAPDDTHNSRAEG